MSLGLLRGFELTSKRRAIRLPLGAQRLLAFLALHDRPLQRGYVAGTLWMGASEARAQACLRSALWRLRRPAGSLVLSSGTKLQLSLTIPVDFRQAAQTARRVIGDRGTSKPGDVDELISAGELLPDWYDDWVLIERERMRQLRLHALEILCRGLTATGDFGPAVEAGLAAVEAEPLRESAHRALIEAHLAEGNRSEAIRQYKAFKKRLHIELRLEPSMELRQLVLGPGNDATSC